MLDEYRHMYAQKADAFLTDFDWRKADKNTLFFNYCKYDDENNRSLSEAYLSAVIVRYWNLINSYHAQGKGAYDAETCYEWLIHCIQYAKDHKPWLKGGNLEGQKNAPDKCINIYMKSMRQGFYQWSNAKKRAIYFTQSMSLDKVMEDTGDSVLPYIDDSKDIDQLLDIKNLVRKEFNSQLYMGAFLIDGIVNAPVIDRLVDKETKAIYTQFNKKKLSKHIRSMDDNYCKTFSKIYDLPVDKVIEARDSCSSLSSTRIYNYLKNTLNKLKVDIQTSKN